MRINFNSKYLTGNELTYIQKVLSSEQLSGDGYFTERCQQLISEMYAMKNTMLTTSATHALEMAALLLDINEEDEVIIPSYTFPSTANAFLLRGAKVIFADSCDENPNIDTDKIHPAPHQHFRHLVMSQGSPSGKEGFTVLKFNF